MAVDIALAAGPPVLPDLGANNAILQVFGGIVALLVFTVGGLLWLRGERVRLSPPPVQPAAPAPVADQPSDNATHLYFNGPLKEIFEQLKTLRGLIYESRELFAQALRETRHDIKNAMHADSIEQSHEIDELKQTIASLRELIVRLDEFMRFHRRG